MDVIGIAKIGLGIIDKIFPDPSEKAKAQALLLAAENEGKFKELESRMQAIVMEAQSKHLFVALARPAFLYVMYFMILGSIPMGFLAALKPELSQLVIQGFQGWLQAIPAEMWALFGAGYLGYVNKRSGDKQALLGQEPKQGLFSRLLG